MLLLADNHLGAAIRYSGTLSVTAALTTGGGGGLYVARTDSGAILEGLTDSSYILEGLTDSCGMLEGLAIVSVQAADKIFLAVYIALWNTFQQDLVLIKYLQLCMELKFY